MASKRIEFIDLAKGICILMVMAVHIAPEIGKQFDFLTCLRMPLYFCLSGLFFKDYGSVRNLVIKKTDKLLIPFVAWYLIGYLIYYIRVFTIGESEYNFKLWDVFFNADFYNMPIWFLLSLFWCNIIFAVICRITDKWIFRTLIVGAIASAGWLFSFYEAGNFLFIATSMVCLPFFFMGKALAETDILYEGTDKKRDLLLIIGSIAICACCILLADDSLRMSFYNNTLLSGNVFSIYLCSAALILATLLICKFIGKIPYISFLGRFSIIVLVTHCLAKNILNRSIRHLIGMEWDEATFNLFLLGVVMALMLLIIPFCRKYLPYITAQKGFLERNFSRKQKSPLSWSEHSRFKDLFSE